MRKVIDLGWCIARLEVTAATAGTLTIVSPADYSSDPVNPAESIRIYGKDGLIALRDLLVETYPLPAPKPEEG